MTHHVSRFDRSACVLSAIPAVQPHRRGMHPPPTDPTLLAKNCYRLAWELHCLLNRRASLSVLLDSYDQRVAKLRREFDEYGAALEAIDPERFARVEQNRRDMADPVKALALAKRDGGEFR